MIYCWSVVIHNGSSWSIYKLTNGWWNDQSMVDGWVMVGECLTNEWLMLSKWLMNDCMSVKSLGLSLTRAGWRLATARSSHRVVLWSVTVCYDLLVWQHVVIRNGQMNLPTARLATSSRRPSLGLRIQVVFKPGLNPKVVQLRIPQGEFVTTSCHWLFPSCLWQTECHYFITIRWLFLIYLICNWFLIRHTSLN